MSILVRKDEIGNYVRELIRPMLELDESYELEDDCDLVALGLDSMKSVNLIVDIEEHFNIMFDDEELLLDNFKTISNIVNRISSKLDLNIE